MNWRKHIHSDADILPGKAVVQGVRISFKFVLDLFVTEWSEQQILENYPTLSSEDLPAIFAFAAECMKEEV